MDNKKIFLGGLLGLVLFLIYQAYTVHENKKLMNNSTNNSAPTSQISTQKKNDIPSINAKNSANSDGSGNGSVPSMIQTNSKKNNFSSNTNTTDFGLIQVKTDNYQIQISNKGGSIIQLGLINYPVSVEKPNEPYLLLKRQPSDIFVANSGLLSKNVRLPNQNDLYQSSKTNYQMGSNTQLIVPLTFENNEVKVVKKFTFTKGSYIIVISYDVSNKTKNNFDLIDYGQFNRKYSNKNSNFLIRRSYVGGSAYLNQKYQKIKLGSIKESPLNQTSNNGWVAMTQHYFFSAWIPPINKSYIYFSKALNNGSYNLGFKNANPITIPANQELKNIAKVNLYAGSKDSKTLKSLAPTSDKDTNYIAKKLYLTADYGWLAFLAEPMFNYMHWIFSWVNSWPLTIFLLVLSIKLVFYKLSETSYRSMAKMRKLAPRLKIIKERCGDDKASFQKEMMGLYKQEKVNPMSGCFPVLIQIPVFISLYWSLLESVELRGVSFLWISDLSLADPFYILPVLMAVTMFVQFKLNPKPADKIQAKVMLFMPLVFSVMFVFFPAALVFYWVVNNSFSILQQYIITKRIGS